MGVTVKHKFVSAVADNSATPTQVRPSNWNDTHDLTTDITGVLKGDGANIVQATAGTDYLTPTGSGAGLTGVLPLSGGTLTGAISGTGATLSRSDTVATSAPLTVKNTTAYGAGGVYTQRIQQWRNAADAIVAEIAADGSFMGSGSLSLGNADIYLNSTNGLCTGTVPLKLSAGYAVNGQYMAFRNRIAGVMTEQMRMDGAGNFGINTTAPTSKLHVVGLPTYANNAAAIAGGLTAGAFYAVTGTDPRQLAVVF